MKIPWLMGLGVLVLGAASGRAATLVNDGILGNSGESGPSLVRFAGEFHDGRAFTQDQGLATVAGIGVAVDRYGFLWDRGGAGQLNRYAVDGRLVGQYKIPLSRSRSDRLTLVGDELIMQLQGRLYALSIAAPVSSAARALGRESDLISYGNYNGKIASLLDGKISLVDGSGAATPLMDAPAGRINQIELTPDGGLAIDGGRDLRVYKGGQLQTTAASLGESLQYLDGYWYGSTWHGTLKRFDSQFKAAPGVVLGGASGSFIGHLDGNYDIDNGRGLARLGPGLFAISGLSGVINLLQWQEAQKSFAIVRRIGALPACRGIYLDDSGMVRVNAGVWKWSDGPDAPQILGSPLMMSGPPAWTSSGVGVVPCVQYGNQARLSPVKNGDLFRPAPVDGEGKAFAGGALGSAITRNGNFFWLLTLFSDGSMRRYRVGGGGEYQGAAVAGALEVETPVRQWSGLAKVDEDTLVGAADGAVIVFKRQGDLFQESTRWHNWGDDGFGNQISLSFAAGHLWVSDTQRQRVLVFNGTAPELLASFGTKDKEGTGLEELSAPTQLTARGPRAVVFDSGNQRLVKLELR
jgi:hypothetical protein